MWKFPISLSGLEMVEVCGHGGRWGGSVFENKGRVWVKVETKSEDSSLSVLIYYVCIRISNTKLPHTQHKIIYPSRIPTNLPVLRIQVKQKTDRLGTIHVQSPPQPNLPHRPPFFAFPPLLFLPPDVVAGAAGLILVKQSFKISSKPSFLLASNMTSSVAMVVRLACLFRIYVIFINSPEGYLREENRKGRKKRRNTLKNSPNQHLHSLSRFFLKWSPISFLFSVTPGNDSSPKKGYI